MKKRLETVSTKSSSLSRVPFVALMLLITILLSSCFGGGGVEKEYSVSGYVVDSSGDPLSGVNIRAQRSGVNATTKESGLWRLDHLKGDERVSASKDGWTFNPPAYGVNGERLNLDFTATKMRFSLAVTKIGEGTVTQEVLSTAQDYELGTKVQITAIPSENWVFDRWEGDLDTTENPTTVVVDKDMEITAVFWKLSTVSGTIGVQHRFPTSVLESRGGASSTSSPLAVHPDLGDELGELSIMFDGTLTEEDERKQLESAGLTIIDHIAILNAYLVQEPATDRGLVQALSLPGAMYVGSNQKVYGSDLRHPNDPGYRYQWHYNQIRLPQAWNVTTGERGIRISIIDSGVDADHPDLRGQLDMENAFNFIDNNQNVQDHSGHGTHVAGTVGALTNNSLGVAGVLWDVQVQLLPLKVLGDDKAGTTWDVAKALLYSAGLPHGGIIPHYSDLPLNPEPVDVANLSLGSSYCEVQYAAVRKAVDAGVIVVASAGNNGGDLMYPARHLEVIAVGAVDYGGGGVPRRASYSSFGHELDVVAPGGDHFSPTVYSTSPGSSYSYMMGTSMAAPHVTGVIGLMLAAGISETEVPDVLTRTAMEIGGTGYNSEYGYGLINAYWAVNAVSEMRVILGERQGNKVVVASESTIAPKGGFYTLPLMRSGRYQLIAWVDVNRNNLVDAGDYYHETEAYDFEPGQDYTDWNGTVVEVGYGL
ncbi:MAG: S8 family serine peptidase [Firmicutes bacterium]|nr:S8 family serine peptidase [Bacillota bacterium]